MAKMNTDNITENPFLLPYDTPFNAIPYNRITLEHFIPAVEEYIKREDEAIKKICSNPEAATFENTIVELEHAGLMLGEVIGAFNALVNARSYDEILAIEEKIELLITVHHNNISLNEELFSRIKKVYSGNTDMLDTDQKRLLEQTYNSFVRNGANLKGKERDDYRRLTENSLRFL